LCRNSTWSYGPQGLPNQACDWESLRASHNYLLSSIKI
jgi:hypothetical protein